MKKALYAILCIGLLLLPVTCNAADTETEEEAVLAEAEYDGCKVSVLDYEYDEAWQSYSDDPGTPAVCIRFYFENENTDPFYLLESFGIAVYQDDTEIEYISLNSEDEEAQNTITSVMDGAGIYCMMAFETTSDSDVELRITEPIADADPLIELILTKDGEVKDAADSQ